MQPLPHTYIVTAKGSAQGNIAVTPEGQQSLLSNAPVQFGGAGDAWSPEDLFVGSVADCFILTFRAIAKFAKLEWLDVVCEAAGELDKLDGVMQFTAINIKASLQVAEGVDASKAEELLHKAERGCLVTNSLKCPVTLTAEVTTA